MDIGDRKDALIVIARKGQRLTMVCDCGVEKIVHVSELKRFSSCGCGAQWNHRQKNHDHEHYSRWCNIKSRCYNPSSPAWHNYGGRGISMCAEWCDDFKQFADGIGKLPSEKYELDRIDNDGNYEPENVRWGLRVVNQRNQRRSCFVCWNDVEIPLWEMCATAGVDYYCAHGAYRRGNDAVLRYMRNKGTTDVMLDDLSDQFRESATGRVTPFVR